MTETALVNKGDTLPQNQNDSVHPLVSAAMAGGKELTPETLDKLLDVQQKWEANEARKAYSAAMVKFREDCPPIFKDALVNFTSQKGTTNYAHETLDGILQTIAPTLAACGINPTFRTNVNDGIITVTCRITHCDGHYEETSLPAQADVSGNKNSIQAIGSTVTYLQRYTLKAMLGLSAGVDNDAQNVQDVELISEEQELELSALIDETNTNKKRLYRYWKIKNLGDLYASNFERFKESIIDAHKARQKKQKETM